MKLLLFLFSLGSMCYAAWVGITEFETLSERYLIFLGICIVTAFCCVFGLSVGVFAKIQKYL